MLLVVAETTMLSYHARFALSTTSFKKFSSTSLPLRSRSPLPRNALRRFAPSEHILIYQLYSPSSTTFFTCFFYLSFFLFRKLLIVSVLFISSTKSITFVFYENKKSKLSPAYFENIGNLLIRFAASAKRSSPIVNPTRI